MISLLIIKIIHLVIIKVYVQYRIKIVVALNKIDFVKDIVVVNFIV